MDPRPEVTRRDALKVGALGAAALTIPFLPGPLAANRVSELAENRIPRPYTLAFRRPPVLQPVGRDGGRDVYEITQSQVRREILPGIKTTLFAYNGTVPGPTIRAQRLNPIVVRQINRLPAKHPTLDYIPWTSTHLHGAPSLPQYDGYANDISLPGQFKDYFYDNLEPGRTLWYHDHCVGHTSENVYMGLAAQYHVLDPAENRLGLPRGTYDVPLIVSDVAFTATGELLFDNRSDSGHMGDVVLVNGVPWPLMPVEPRKYRFRLLVATNARSFRFRLSNNAPLNVIGTDGGLVQRPIPVNELLVGMAERYDLVIDFAPYRGQRIELRNIEPDNTIDYDDTDKVMAFQVGQTVGDATNNVLPATLAPLSPVMALRPEQAVKTRRIRFERQGSEWVVDGQTWDDVIRSEFRKTIAEPRVGDVEIWELENTSGGWFHPIHVHLVDFKVLDRNGRPPRPQEQGPKDTVYVGEGNVVRIIAEFGSLVTPPGVPEVRRAGRYMMHCHNVTHEDHDMMTQFWVGGQGAGPDPILADPPRNLPAPPIPPLV
ncbi:MULTISPECIES: multicopper oxidase family protein [unclassified Geodermatophilus]|uniref:multicopper oxidase family protein n=1 Tax=unclassified Geodermatophilus TaxID=2637632 RepID=UPI003EED2F79